MAAPGVGHPPAAEHPPRRVLGAWERLAAGAGSLAAIVALAVTLRADFLAHPGWLALQKADLILGPIAVGLYWRHVRPRSRFGPMLVGLGILQVPYIAHSSSNDVLFTFGVHWEGVIYLATLAIILAFPSGRLDRPLDRAILAVAALGVVVPSSAITLLSPEIFAGGSISSCASACPDNALVLATDPVLANRLFELDRAAIIVVALATAALLVWRLIAGTPPQRRSLAIGTPIALVFLLTQAGYQLTLALGVDPDLGTYVRWTFAIARAALWYGFLLALVVAQLFAGRVLRQILTESLRGTSPRDVEALLRWPLGDPQLKLAWWDERAGVWADADGSTVEPPAAGSERTLTVQERDGGATAAIVHDAELAEDPELLQAAGAVALLVFENTELKGAWHESLRELRRSRARILAASADERRRLERDLHDGAQQRLLAVQIELAAVAEEVDDPAVMRELEAISRNVAAAVEECRMLAQGLYPSLLRERGLLVALQSVARQAGAPVTVRGRGVRRHAVNVEEAVYFCAREAIQNATKHGGPATRITIDLSDGADGGMHFAIVDDGRGFNSTNTSGGLGIANMRDRIVAIGGRLEIVSQPGHGTAIRGAIPRAPARELGEPPARS